MVKSSESKNLEIQSTKNKLTGYIVSSWSKPFDSSVFGGLPWEFGVGFVCK